MKRSLDMIVLSGIHLGSQNNQIETLQQYLDQVCPKAIVLNGNFITHALYAEEDISIIKTLTKMAEEGTRIYFIANNVPMALQAYPEFFHQNVFFENRLTLRLKGKKYLFLNDNFTKDHLSTPYSNLSPQAFYGKAQEKAIKENADYVICGHHCMPSIKITAVPNRRMFYMHSGCWSQHLSALEYHCGSWSLYQSEEISTHISYQENDMDWASDLDDGDVLVKKSVIVPYF